MIFLTCFLVVSEKCKVNSIFALFIANVFAIRIIILILGKLLLWRINLIFLNSIDLWLKLVDIDIKDVLWLLLLGSTFFLIFFCIFQVLLGTFLHRYIHIVFESILSDFSHSAALIIVFSNCWERVYVKATSSLLLVFDVLVDVAACRTSRIRNFLSITLFWIMNIENHFSLLDWQWSARLQIDRIILWHRNYFGY